MNDIKKNVQKVGTVALIGRPNVGKSTLLNNLLGQKVSITSPKPQTTRFEIHAVYEDDRGQIIFIDTPGIMAKVRDSLAGKINLSTEKTMAKNIDLVIYMIDHTRGRDIEENRTLGLIRKVKVPKILVINKIDIKRPTHIVEYKFLEDEFEYIVRISALKRLHFNKLLETIFNLLPQGIPEKLKDQLATPTININSNTFISEIIREKAFLNLRKEVPYSITTEVDEIIERKNGDLYIKGKIITSADRYKGMIIGSGGKMIKQIGMEVRKELEVSTGKNVYVDLTVEVDEHWMEKI